MGLRYGSWVGLGLLALVACGDGDDDAARLPGESDVAFGARVSTWAVRGELGEIVEVGATIPIALIENAPLDDEPSEGDAHGTGDGPAGAILSLRYPEEVRDTTFIDHLEVHWNAFGHEPDGVYTVPHFDFHFYGVPEEVVWAVDCADGAVQPSPDRVPPPYIPLPVCVPEMGVHSLDPRSPEVDPVNPQQFTEVFIYGFQAGELAFLEPMLTRDYLLEIHDLEVDLPLPEVLGRSTRLPSVYRLTYDAEDQSYDMVLSDFVAFD